MAERGPGNEREGVQVTEVTSTPSSFPAVASPSTLAQLEFSAALDHIAGRAVSELGAARVRQRLPSADAGWVAGQLADVAELATVLARQDPFRPEAVADLTEILGVLSVQGSVLEAPALVALGGALGAMRVMSRDLARLRDVAPRTATLRVDPPPRELEQAIDRALEPDGSVKDDASPELKRARAKVRDTRSRLVARLEAALGQLAPADRAAGTVTLREGRYVIPVPRGMHRLPGIVHGASGSGSTLFVEPEAAVGLGNELREYEADEARAVLAVLRDLTDQARASADRIAAGWEMCIALDDLYARARYACEVGAAAPNVATFPEVLGMPRRDFTAENAESAENVGEVGEGHPAEPPAPVLVIRTGRHPLLIGEGTEVVPFDLSLSGDAVALVISGPNTGGKTVLLKAIGLMAALVQAGVLPPLAEGSQLPVFRRIFADIGDHQSIAASLSTFSAHVAALRGILAEADASSLVLVDEIGNGTDPIEGGALGAAALLALVRRRATTVVTTHLAQLKDVAARTPGVENASLEFDAATLTPTYRFLQGVPGRSYGLAVARRLGVPADVLGEAESIMPAAQRTLEALLADLEAKTQEVERRERDAESLRATLAAREAASQASADELHRREHEVAAKEREVERAGREQARQFLLEARRRVEEALAIARAAVSEATAREARRLVEEGVQREAEALKKLEAEAGAKGWRVKGGTGKQDVRKEAPARPGPSASVLAPASSDVDLRGLTVDEATATVVAALDAAVVNDLPWLRIIHGKGTGALRAAVQELLRADSRVAGFRLAPPQEGGAGVTLVEFQP
ncbi:MAG TPA: Smr/MutS family protein [Gemmatimonadales bacterium]|nr:Smr/MutS family protein [Gemmatimonadales bacterium]